LVEASNEALGLLPNEGELSSDWEEERGLPKPKPTYKVAAKKRALPRILPVSTLWMATTCPTTCIGLIQCGSTPEDPAGNTSPAPSGRPSCQEAPTPVGRVELSALWRSLAFHQHSLPELWGGSTGGISGVGTDWGAREQCVNITFASSLCGNAIGDATYACAQTEYVSVESCSLSAEYSAFGLQCIDLTDTPMLQAVKVFGGAGLAPVSGESIPAQVVEGKLNAGYCVDTNYISPVDEDAMGNSNDASAQEESTEDQKRVVPCSPLAECPIFGQRRNHIMKVPGLPVVDGSGDIGATGVCLNTTSTSPLRENAMYNWKVDCGAYVWMPSANISTFMMSRLKWKEGHTNR